MKVNMNVIVLILGFAGVFTLGFFIGRSLSPINMAFSKANRYLVRQNIPNKEKAMEIMDAQKNFIELSIQTVRVDEMRRMIALSLVDQYIKREM